MVDSLRGHVSCGMDSYEWYMSAMMRCLAYVAKLELPLTEHPFDTARFATFFSSSLSPSLCTSKYDFERRSVLTDEENCPRIPKKNEKRTTSSASSTAHTMSECNNAIVRR